MTLWENMLIDIKKEFQNKENFLQHKTISKTISPNHQGNTQNHLDYVRKSDYISDNILPKVLDTKVGMLGILFAGVIVCGHAVYHTSS